MIYPPKNTITFDILDKARADVRRVTGIDLVSGKTGAEQTVITTYKQGYHIPEMRIIQSALALEEWEDWSGVRSPSRARRRLKRGHRQNIVIRHKPTAYRSGDTLIVHPEWYRHIADRMRDKIDQQLRAGFMVGMPAHYARDERNGVTTHGDDDNNHGASDE